MNSTFICGRSGVSRRAKFLPSDIGHDNIRHQQMDLILMLGSDSQRIIAIHGMQNGITFTPQKFLNQVSDALLILYQQHSLGSLGRSG